MSTPLLAEASCETCERIVLLLLRSNNRTWQVFKARGEFSFSGPKAILNWGPFWKADVAVVTFSNSNSALVPKCLNPNTDPKNF